MALGSSKLAYPFASGLDQEIDRRVVPQNLVGCMNGVWRRDGRIEKRPGQSTVLGVDSLTGQQSMVIAGTKLATIGQNNFSVLDQKFQRFSGVSEQTAPTLMRTANIQSAQDVEHADIAYCEGYTVIGYSTTEAQSSRRGVYYQVIDQATGEVIVPETLIIESSTQYLGQVRVQKVSGLRAHLYYIQATAGIFSLRMRVIGLDPMTVGGAIVIGGVTPTAQNLAGETLWSYDSSSQSGTNSVVVYWNLDAPAALETVRVSPDGATLNRVTTAITQAPNPGQVAIYAEGQITDSVGAIILYQQEYNATIPQNITINLAYTAVLAGPVSTLMPVLSYSALFMVRSNDGIGAARTILNVANDAASGIVGSERIQFAERTLALGGASAPRVQLWGRVVAKPYWYTSQGATTPFVFPVLPIQMVVDVTPQPNITLVAIYALDANKPAGTVPWDVLPIGRLNVDTAQDQYLLRSKGTIVALRDDTSIDSPHSTEWLAPVLIGTVVRNLGGPTAPVRREARPDILSVNHGATFPVRYVEQADNAYVVGGALQSFTGGVLREQAYNFRPYITVPAGVVPVPGVTFDYNYVAIYEQTDERGDRIRSGPSAGNAISLALAVAGGNPIVVTLRVPVYVASQQPEANSGPCRLAIFRTLASGSLYFRVATIAGKPGAGPYTVWPTITFTDGTTDAELEVSEPLYANTALPSDPTPAPIDVATYQERVAIISAQEPDEVWISKQKENDIAAEFSSTLRVRVPSGRGDATALAAMDEKLIIFKESSIYAIASDGPNAIGQGSFGQAREVTSDIGCINKHSVDVNEAGIVFESPAGIYLLDRGLNLKFLGGPVQDYFPGTGPVVGRSVCVQAAKEIYFYLNGTGTVLCYNYRWDRWTVHTYGGSLKDIGMRDDALVTMVNIDNRWFVRTIGANYADARDDGSFAYSLLIQTPWFKTDGMEGWQRTRNLRFLADYASAHDLVVTFYCDNDDTTPAGQWTFANANIDPGALGLTYQVKVKLPRQKSQSVRFDFEDSAAGGDGSAFRALEMMLEYATKQSGVPVAVARKG